MLKPERRAEECDLAAEILERGFALRRQLVSEELVSRLRLMVDVGLAAEQHLFPEGDTQHGRLLFAPVYGGAFLDLLEVDEIFDPVESIVSSDAILYTYTTSVLKPHEVGPAREFHVDIAFDRPLDRTLAVMVALTPFSSLTGGTEFVVGSHRWESTRSPTLDDERSLLIADPGDVCYFHPRIWHRSGINTSSARRDAVLTLSVPAWMKQRFDVRSLMSHQSLSRRNPVVSRRLGFESLPPASAAEFLQNRSLPLSQ